LIYQHAIRDRERAIGAAVSALIEASHPMSKGHTGGADRRSAAERHRLRNDESALDLGQSAWSG
jgi:hypothetical protein